MSEPRGLTIADGGDRPLTFQRFSSRFPGVTEAHAALGAATDEAGPLSAREQQLAKLGLCVGAGLESATKSHVRRALEAGLTREEIEHAILQGVGTLGFSTTVRAWVWATEQMDAEAAR
jgi:alkylhydroperoxidase/carboxymuconolactone decarboxylase family protein YurZ